MGFQWTLIVGVMYTEMAAISMLLLPCISPHRWHSVMEFVRRHNITQDWGFGWYARCGLVGLAACFVQAVNQIIKFNLELQHLKQHHHRLDAEFQAQKNLFRAQRNLYISGMSIFLYIVLQRLMSLLSRLAVSLAQGEAAIKQAKSASEAAAQLMKQGEEGHEEHQQQEANVSNEIKELKEGNQRLEEERKVAKRQAEEVGLEYERLLEEYSSLKEQDRRWQLHHGVGDEGLTGRCTTKVTHKYKE